MARLPTGSPASCPTCGAPAEEGQLVCLECGSRVTLGYRRPPSWRVPVAIVLGVLLLAIVVAAVALKEIGEGAEREVGSTPIKAPESSAAKGAGGREPEGKAKREKDAAREGRGERRPSPREPAERKLARKPTAPAPASGTGLVQRGILYAWPRDLRAFTIVLLSAEDRASADRFARSASEGRPAKIGVLRADDFESLPKGFFVVFAGQYKDRPTADRAAARLGRRFSGAFPQLVER